MANKMMKTLTIGENTYEIVDAAARNDIELIKQDMNNIEVDTSLSVEGMAADAKATGDAINNISSSMVKTINNTAPDENGNVNVQAGVTSVNGQTGDVTIEQYDVLPLSKGGTEATTAIGARENMLMVVSATEPTSPTTGMLWFDIS